MLSGALLGVNLPEPRVQPHAATRPILLSKRWDAHQSRLKTIDANQPVITAIMAVATPYTRP